MEVAFVIGWAGIFFSSILISIKDYRTLKSRGNNYAAFLAAITFLISFIIITFASIIILIFFNRGFGRM